MPLCFLNVVDVIVLSRWYILMEAKVEQIKRSLWYFETHVINLIWVCLILNFLDFHIVFVF